MDTRKFLGNLTNAADLLVRAPHMLFAKPDIVDGTPCISFGFTNEPKRHTEHFADIDQRDLWWKEFVSIMTTMCNPACICIGTALFQPLYLRRFVCYTNEQMHFVILDFGNNCAVWLGCHSKEQQIALYADLSKILDSCLEPQQPSPFSKYFSAPN